MGFMMALPSVEASSLERIYATLSRRKHLTTDPYLYNLETVLYRGFASPL